MERNYYLYLAIGLTIAITIGSLVSAKEVSIIEVQFSDKVVHSGAYFALALSWFLTFNKKFKVFKQFFKIAVFLFFYGIIIEVCQKVFTSDREADIFDMIANLIGILLALFVFYLIIKKNK